MGAVAPSIASPRDMPDTVLLAARLARCLTLLTQGTAHDVITQAVRQSFGLAAADAHEFSSGRPCVHRS